MNDILIGVGWSALGAGLFMSGTFLMARIIDRYDLVDIAWGLGFMVVALVSYLTGPQGARAALVTVLVALWGLRLATHIFLRWRKRPEDKRYVELRQKWGSHPALQAYLSVFLTQGLLLLVISLPVIIVNTTTFSHLNTLDYLGVLIWAVGFFFESVGDHQLTRFLSNPNNKGKLMTGGLWRYTRHPNYFGEVTQWWGIWLIALSVPWGWLGVIGPLTITILITKISGVPLTEKSYGDRPDWALYKAKTSVLFPLPPKTR